MMHITSLTSAMAERAAAVEKACLTVAWSAAILAELEKNPLAHYLVALEGENVIGVLSAYFVAEECQVMNLAVLPAYRRHGVAQALLQNMLSRAAAANCRFASLEVAADNVGAISFYEKNAFRLVGRRKNYYHGAGGLRQDALLYDRGITKEDLYEDSRYRVEL